MIVMMRMIRKCLFSPRLLKVYHDGALDEEYKPTGPEKWGDKIITSASALFSMALYTTPIVGLYLYKKEGFGYDDWRWLANICGSISCFVAFGFLMRAFGRAHSNKYKQFLRTLEGQPGQRNDVYMAGIQKYDFDFSAWPPSYVMPQETGEPWMNPFGTTTHANRPFYVRVTIQLLAYIVAHTFGIRLVYPGCLGFIQNLMYPSIFQGRTILVQLHNGLRAKVKTADGNDIDTMFVDNRWSNPLGETLVVCCEGNSGYYEVGLMTTPIKNGYSALGWNHPGFACSTGIPYPSQERNAINAVIHYAIHKLGFRAERIVMYGWSIGGYSAAWVAAHFPIKALILDATFDDLLPLAENQMPASWSLLVKEVIRSYVNLHIAELLKSYSGRIHLVRRTDDEIICLRHGLCFAIPTPYLWALPNSWASYITCAPQHGWMAYTKGTYRYQDCSLTAEKALRTRNRGLNETNRGNHLLVEIVRQRHPEVMRDNLGLLVSNAHTLAELRPTVNEHMPQGEQDVLNYLTKYMRDYRSTHCTPLPDNMFQNIMTHMLGPIN